MNDRISFNNHEKAFYSDGYKLGMEASPLSTERNAFFPSLKTMYSVIDELIESISDLAQKHGQAIHCKKGCEWCCHQPVYALSYELDYLNTFIKENLDLLTQNEMAKRADKKRQKLSGLTGSDLLNSKFPCPLLKDGKCMAYEARPMACRIYLSTNVSSCMKFFYHPDDKTNFPALLDFPMRAGRMMNEGFKAALKTRGNETKEFRIEEKLLGEPGHGLS